MTEPLHNQELGPLFKAARERQGLNQREAGEHFGVSNASVSSAQATIALVYEQRRTNELLEQLLAKS